MNKGAFAPYKTFTFLYVIIPIDLKILQMMRTSCYSP